MQNFFHCNEVANGFVLLLKTLDMTRLSFQWTWTIFWVDFGLCQQNCTLPKI